MKGRTWVAALLAVGVVAGCGAPSDDALEATDELDITTTTTAPQTTTTTTATVDDAPCDASLAPFPEQPRPGHMPDGILAEIQAREDSRLRVGVDQNTLGFGWRDRDGELEGFDISLAEAIGEAMFGETGHVDLIPVTSRERIDAVDGGHVDMVISLMSITCERATQVAFSAEYFRAHQRVLVPGESGIESVDDLNGRTVCATSRSTSVENLADFAPRAIPYEVPSRTDCLVALQQGLVDAISTDDTILFGFMAQDPKLELVPEEEVLSQEQYGIAIKLDPEHEALVRFVNGVLEEVEADGRWHQFVADAEADLNRRPGRHVDIEADAPPPLLYRDET